MAGIGLIVAFFGYAILYWAINSFSGSQDSFMSYILPWVAK